MWEKPRGKDEREEKGQIIRKQGKRNKETKEGKVRGNKEKGKMERRN